MMTAVGIGRHLATCSGLEDLIYRFESCGLGCSGHLLALESIIKFLRLLVLTALVAESLYQVCIVNLKFVLVNMHG